MAYCTIEKSEEQNRKKPLKLRRLHKVAFLSRTKANANRYFFDVSRHNPIAQAFNHLTICK